LEERLIENYPVNFGEEVSEKSAIMSLFRFLIIFGIIFGYDAHRVKRENDSVNMELII
jgi:hypothetical protein